MMRKQFKGLIASAVIVCLTGSALGQVFDYVQQGADWTGTCATGVEQSPIDVVAESVLNVDEAEPSPTLILNGVDSVFEINNNGYTYKFTPTASQHGVMYDQPESYIFQQFHFHAPAEHTFDGVQRTLEFHAVFGASAAEPNPRNHVVVGITFVALDTATPHAGLQAVIDAGAPAVEATREVVDGNLDLAMFIPDNTSLEMVTYPGSLTTPECAEIVNWMLYTQAISVPTSQLDYFTSAFAYEGTLGNYRAVDPTKNPDVAVRRVRWALTSSDPTIGAAGSSSPTLMFFSLVVIGLVALF